jgi:hypothetical protein
MSYPTGPKPDAGDGSAMPKSAGGGNSKWRQTVQHAKKTAFLAVGAYVAMNVSATPIALVGCASRP